MRKCNCSGNCGPQGNNLTRREFITLVGAGAAGTLLGSQALAAFNLPPEQFESWRRSVMGPSMPRLYLSDKHTDARMHLGGIGTGNFEIGADGQFTTWQLFNTLRDGNVPFYFLVRVGAVAKLLQTGTGLKTTDVRNPDGPAEVPKLVQTTGGPDWPRVKQIEMTGEYPIARLRFLDDDLPVSIELTAFSPFAPLDARFSEMPLAAFMFRIHNPTGQQQTVSLAALMQNPVGYDARDENQSIHNPAFGANVNDVLREGQAKGLFLYAEPSRVATLDRPGQNYKAPGFGTLALAALHGEISVLPAFEDWDEAWNQFSANGHFTSLAEARANSPTPEGHTINGAVASTVMVPAGQTIEVPFLLAWHYPNKYNSAGVWMGCHYATEWPDARAVVKEGAENFAELQERTEGFRKTFYDSTLPYWLLDSVTANIGIIRHIGVVFRIANGDIYAWEGSNGCCEPTCTHVYGYEQTLAHLFPLLEREMRRIDFKHQQGPDGGINNRTDVPSPPRPTNEHPFSDGHASCILKAYREALNSPDETFFHDYWPNVKHAVEYLIDRDAKGNDGKPIGLLQDDQWNTYDEALHGVTTFIGGYYLAALRAGEEWARRMGDAGTAARFHSIFESGQSKLIELCWNGEYFQQHLPDYINRKGEVGPGCMSDQLIGQWWAHQLGLGYILPQDMVVAALRSIFKYNFKSDFTGWKFAPRALAGAKDKGLIICTWPRGGRPAAVMNYSDEVWTGIEYQVAAHMVYEGMMEEAFDIVKAARDRYDGIPRPPIPRNPWCEIECGGHYARAMASWSLLLAVSGYEFDGPAGILRFNPRWARNDFKCFFSAPAGWGTFTQTVSSKIQNNTVAVQSGVLAVKTLRMGMATEIKVSKAVVTIAGKIMPVNFRMDDGSVEIDLGREKVILKQGETLETTLS